MMSRWRSIEDDPGVYALVVSSDQQVRPATKSIEDVVTNNPAVGVSSDRQPNGNPYFDS
jgi:hypothetical protein